MTRCPERVPFVLIFLTLVAAGLASQDQLDYNAPEGLWSFAMALYDEGDYARAAGEFLRYLFLAGGRSCRQEALFRVAKCRQLSGEMEPALEGFRRLAQEESAVSDRGWAVRARYEIAITSALLGRNEEALSVLGDPALPALTPVYDAALLTGWCLLLKHDWAGAETALGGSVSKLAPELASIAAEGGSLPRRSPAIAGILSTLIPGAGKLYAGRVADGLFSFGLIGSLAVLSGLGFADEGLKSVRGWVYGSVGLLFHAGNVYGAIVAARQFNQNGDLTVESRARDFYGERLR